jgi:hypothetical protein
MRLGSATTAERRRRLRSTPRRPIALKSRATVQRATRTPSRRSSFHTFFAPYRQRVASHTRRIAGLSVVSRCARAGRRVASRSRAFVS